MIELEPQPEQQPALQDAAGHRRVTHRAEQDRVVLGQLGQHGLGEKLPGRVPARRAEVVGRRLGTGRDFPEHLQRLGDDLRPDPVSGNHRQSHDLPPPRTAPVLPGTDVPTARYRLR
jgi:hypothetical protein